MYIRVSAAVFDISTKTISKQNESRLSPEFLVKNKDRGGKTYGLLVYFTFCLVVNSRVNVSKSKKYEHKNQNQSFIKG